MSNLFAITMCYDTSGTITPGAEYNFIRREYGESIQRAGGQPIFIDPSIDPETVARLVEGVIISGGNDIDPALYGQKNTACQKLEPRARSDWERRLIDACDIEGVPILGICYGNQLLNVHYGGTLYQDIAAEHGSTLDHGTSQQAALHGVTFSADILGYKKGQSIASTARHHQSVRDLAPGFVAAGRADDGIIEAICGNGHFGIQWHPESDESRDVIYANFIEHCRDSARPLSLADHLPLTEGAPI